MWKTESKSSFYPPPLWLCFQVVRTMIMVVVSQVVLNLSAIINAFKNVDWNEVSWEAVRPLLTCLRCFGCPNLYCLEHHLPQLTFIGLFSCHHLVLIKLDIPSLVFFLNFISFLSFSPWISFFLPSSVSLWASTPAILWNSTAVDACLFAFVCVCHIYVWEKEREIPGGFCSFTSQTPLSSLNHSPPSHPPSSRPHPSFFFWVLLSSFLSLSHLVMKMFSLAVCFLPSFYSLASSPLADIFHSPSQFRFF